MFNTSTNLDNLATEPLASKFRPSSLDEFVGQQHLIGPEGPIRKFIESNKIPSMIFWGPPGTGKTTLAYIISQYLQYDFYKLQAVMSGKEQLRKIIGAAMANTNYNKQTILFIDEIHRWNKAQQDALLPYVEKGIVTLIGATTENPSFTVNNALLSRSKVFVFEQHTPADVSKFLADSIKKNKMDIKFGKGALELIGELSNGDMRTGINTLEMAITLSSKVQDLNSKEKGLKINITTSTIKQAIQMQVYYDKDGEEHYNIISAVHKSMRSSNPDAAAYWVMRMLEAGDDPLYVARRLLRFAAEDIGNADPMALILAETVFETCKKIGMPECDVHLIQLAVYLAKAPKDNSAYRITHQTREDVRKFGNLPVPMHLRNAPTDLMKDLGYGKGYEYDHDLKSKKSTQECLPEKLKGRRYG